MKLLLQQPTFRKLVLGVVVVVVLVSAWKITAWRSQASQQTIVGDIKHLYDEGMALVDLNPLRGRTLLKQAETQLMQALQDKGEKNPELEALLAKVKQGLVFANRKYEVTPTPFYELDLVRPGGVGNRLSLDRDTLLILDSINKSLYSVALRTKAAQIVAGGEVVSQARDILKFQEKAYVLTAMGVFDVSKTPTTQIIKKDSAWGSVDTLAYFDGNFYVLDPTANQIWKYIPTDGTWSRHAYLDIDTQAILNSAHNLAVDGSVWVISQNQISKFVQGKETVWKIQGLDDPLGSDLDLFTFQDSLNVYILDREKERVVVLTKDGEYLAQYVWHDRSINDFVVSEELKKILLLSRGTIYGIDLK